MDLSITILFVAVLALIQVPITVLVGIRRAQTGVMFLHGEDDILLHRMRAHANFTEMVPITLLAMAAAELSGGSELLLWAGGGALVIGRVCSYIGLTSGDGTGPLRGVGAGLPTISLVSFSIFTLYTVIT